MKLYHGSNLPILDIDLKKCKPYKDFGQGFYLSDDFNQAEEMATFKALTLGGDPIVSEFEFDMDALMESGLSVKFFQSYSEEWVDFIIANRNGLTVGHLDFVYGPIADDKVGFQLRRFNDQTISKQELLERLKYMKGITFQYFFGTPHSLQYLHRI